VPAAAAKTSADTSSLPDLPRDGLVVLVGLLLMGLAIAFRAIRARERRIGFALLGFCVIYLLALAGLATGVAGVS
jgi:Ca2+/Na+ antiporter